jgi:5'-methylthioadenosine phosphorylase
LLPSEVPYKANIYALKSLGVERIIAINAVGSLMEAIAPQQFAVPDQLIDRTQARANSFFGNGFVAHIPFADPICPVLSRALHEAGQDIGATVHMGGTYIVTEGPAFSTRAESNLYRSWNASIIGMTALPEARLAREAEICYAVLACVTDYDSWHSGHESVNAEMVISGLSKSIETAKRVVALAISRLPSDEAERKCDCGSALKHAFITRSDDVPSSVKANLEPIIGRYIS